MALRRPLRFADKACQQVLDCALQQNLAIVDETCVQQCLDAVREELLCRRRVTLSMKQMRRDLIRKTPNKSLNRDDIPDDYAEVWIENKRRRYGAAPLVADLSTTISESGGCPRSTASARNGDGDDESECWGVTCSSLF